MENRGLLTGDDRAFYQGEKDADDPEKVGREKRYNLRRRIENIEEDITILREAGEEDVLQDLYAAVGRYERLEKQLERLEQRVDETQSE